MASKSVVIKEITVYETIQSKCRYKVPVYSKCTGDVTIIHVKIPKSISIAKRGKEEYTENKEVNQRSSSNNTDK